MDMRNNNRRNVLTHARVKFYQSETSSLLRGGELTEKVLKFLLKKTLFSVHAIESKEKSENYMAQKVKLVVFCSSFLVSLAFH